MMMPGRTEFGRIDGCCRERRWGVRKRRQAGGAGIGMTGLLTGAERIPGVMEQYARCV